MLPFFGDAAHTKAILVEHRHHSTFFQWTTATVTVLFCKKFVVHIRTVFLIRVVTYYLWMSKKASLLCLFPWKLLRIFAWRGAPVVLKISHRDLTPHWVINNEWYNVENNSFYFFSLPPSFVVIFWAIHPVRQSKDIFLSANPTNWIYPRYLLLCMFCV